MKTGLDMALYGRKNLFSGQLGLERTRTPDHRAVLPFSLSYGAKTSPVNSGGALARANGGMRVVEEGTGRPMADYEGFPV